MAGRSDIFALSVKRQWIGHDHCDDKCPSWPLFNEIRSLQPNLFIRPRYVVRIRFKFSYRSRRGVFDNNGLLLNALWNASRSRVFIQERWYNNAYQRRMGRNRLWHSVNVVPSIVTGMGRRKSSAIKGKVCCQFRRELLFISRSRKRSFVRVNCESIMHEASSDLRSVATVKKVVQRPARNGNN